MCKAYIGTAGAPRWLEADAVVERGVGAKAQRRAAYRKFVEEQVKQGRMDTPWEELQDRVILGSADFIAALKKQARAVSKKSERSAWPPERVPLESILQAIERAKNERWDEFKDRYGDGGLALALTMARKYSGLTLAETSRRLGLAPTMNTSITIQRYRQRLQNDRPERELAATVDQMK